ncbi:MAG: beta-mannanase [Candidatus Goldbacteria bacterium]|nr:beta-mannanase [Candidatus Goldiibacteriota bacterium]
MKKIFLLNFFLFFVFYILAIDININTEKGKTPISPYIYGVNQDIAPDVKVTSRRLGGNRMTGYNWENNASNAGSDWQHYSDNYMMDWLNEPGINNEEPAKLITVFHERSLTKNAYSLITLQLAGYVSKDKNGPVSMQETAPSHRWAKVVFEKGSELSLNPDKNDNFVYLDEELNFLINKFGLANTPTGIKGYVLDNEPDLWSHTHPRIHPQKAKVEEYIEKSIAVAKVVKKMDPYAEIFGPASYGFNGFRTFQDAPDFYEARWKYDWFLAYYLARMKEASDKEGKRLLDVLDIHWYPEAQGNGKRIVFSQGAAEETAEARVQAPRSLWDREYIESSWICSSGHCPIYLIPRLKEMIDKYYPGTKLAITEYEYGAGFHPSGGVALADVLGIFGKYGVYMANYWMCEWGTYSLSAFRLYRNYDGKGGVYGDINVSAKSSDIEKMTTYAALDSNNKNNLHIILINKDLTNTQTARVNILSKSVFKNIKIYGFDKSSDGKITERESPVIKSNKFSIDMPPLSAYHVLLSNN